jgi:hypothetical protein
MELESDFYVIYFFPCLASIQAYLLKSYQSENMFVLKHIVFDLDDVESYQVKNETLNSLIEFNVAGEKHKVRFNNKKQLGLFLIELESKY